MIYEYSGDNGYLWTSDYPLTCGPDYWLVNEGMHGTRVSMHPRIEELQMALHFVAKDHHQLTFKLGGDTVTITLVGSAIKDLDDLVNAHLRHVDETAEEAESDAYRRINQP